MEGMNGRRDIIKNKIRAVGKLTRIMNILRKEHELVTQLKGLTPNGLLPIGALAGGKGSLTSALSSFKHGQTATAPKVEAVASKVAPEKASSSEKPPREHKERKEGRESRETRESKDHKTKDDHKEHKEHKEAKEPKEHKDTKESKDAK